MRRNHLSALGLFGMWCWSLARADAAGGWITHPGLPSAPVVLEFARDFTLARVPSGFRVQVTADQRYLLFVNGRRVGAGPSAGTIQSWRQAGFDLAPYLRAGHNEITAWVWNFAEHAPLAQQSVATGLRLQGPERGVPVGTADSGWRVRIRADHAAASGAGQLKPEYYVASAPEIIDSRVSPGEWSTAVPAPEASARTLVDDPLPPQQFSPADAGRTVRASHPGLDAFPGRSVVVPARTQAKLLLRRDAMISAYPVLRLAGGRDARVGVTYAEALYDASGKKGDRDQIGDRHIAGLRDEFIADGSERSFATLWWRTWRYLQIDVQTADESLTLAGLDLFETGYPFAQIGRFASDDPELDRIFEIGWRTLRVDAHETFMDSSYWEQLQYAGDTRIEMLISYIMSGDPRLGRQAIDAFAESNVEGGIMEGAYPSRGRNVITTFSLAWIAMLHDWWREQPDVATIRRHLPRTRQVLAWFEKLRTPSGLLGANPHWNFIDWAGQSWDDRTVFPSYGRDGGSCLMTVLWLGALEQASELERAVGATPGHVAAAELHARRANAARSALREHCWDAGRGLYADNPDKDVYSQHMNVLAVLYDVATREQAPGILERITVPGRGIDAPEGMFTTTYYFAWYLIRAYEHAGLADRYFDLLATWRELLELNYTTWPESRGDTRSDTHAWSAHPTADLLRIVAGIRSGAPGYARVHIAPSLGLLKRVDATAATPRGPVTVRYRVDDGTLSVEIHAPRDLPGEFVWLGKRYPFKRSTTRLTLPVRESETN